MKALTGCKCIHTPVLQVVYNKTGDKRDGLQSSVIPERINCNPLWEFCLLQAMLVGTEAYWR